MEEMKSRYAIPQPIFIKQVIKKFGGPSSVAMICHIQRPSVHKWKHQIPAEAMLCLLAYGREKGIPITLAEMRPELFTDI